MKITIQSIYGALCHITAEPKNTVGMMKNFLSEKLNIKSNDQELQYLGKVLKDDDTLENLEIMENSIVLLRVLNQDNIMIAKNDRLLFGILEPMGNFLTEKKTMKTNIVTTPVKPVTENKVVTHEDKVSEKSDESHYVKNEPVITGVRALNSEEQQASIKSIHVKNQLEPSTSSNVNSISTPISIMQSIDTTKKCSLGSSCRIYDCLLSHSEDRPKICPYGNECSKIKVGYEYQADHVEKFLHPAQPVQIVQSALKPMIIEDSAHSYPPIHGTLQNTPESNTDEDNIATIITIVGCDPAEAKQMYNKYLKNTQLAINHLLKKNVSSYKNKCKKKIK